jgi:hypothetical protein
MDVLVALGILLFLLARCYVTACSLFRFSTGVFICGGALGSRLGSFGSSFRFEPLVSICPVAADRFASDSDSTGLCLYLGEHICALFAAMGMPALKINLPSFYHLLNMCFRAFCADGLTFFEHLCWWF